MPLDWLYYGLGFVLGFVTNFWTWRIAIWYEWWRRRRSDLMGAKAPATLPLKESLKTFYEAWWLLRRWKWLNANYALMSDRQQLYVDKLRSFWQEINGDSKKSSS